MRKTILIIGGGVLQVPAAKAAKEMGLFTLVTDMRESAPAMKYADVPVIMSTRDIEGTVREARRRNRRRKIDGVITVGTDASRTVAAVAAALDLPGIRYSVAEAATDKIKMRERFAAGNVPSPAYVGCYSKKEVKDAFRRLPFPLVVKPSDNMGARGVRKATSMKDFEVCYAEAKEASVSGGIIVEEYMPGHEYPIDALVYGGRVHVTGVADRMINREPHFVEIGHIIPTNRPKREVEQVLSVFKAGIRALGIDCGAAKGDIKFTPKGAMVGEIAARLSGGFMSGFTYPYATGVPLTKNALRVALGMPPKDLHERHNRVSVERAIIVKRPGRIVAIEGVEEALAIPGVKNVFLYNYKVGGMARRPRNNVEKGGNVITVADTRRRAMSIATRALRTIKIRTSTAKRMPFPERAAAGAGS